MDKEILVENIRKSIEELEKKEGDFTFVMIVPTDPNSDPYSSGTKLDIVVSSQWLDQSEPKNAIDLISNKLKNNIQNDDMVNINRINVINSNDNFIQSATSAFNIEDSIVYLKNTNIFGIYIPNAIILESKKPIPLNSINRIIKKSGNFKFEPKAMKLLLRLTEKYIADLSKKATECAKDVGRDTLIKEDIEKAVNSLK